MANIPTMREGKIGFRSPSNSNQQNEMQQQLFDDVIRLFDVTNGLEQELQASEEALEMTSRFQTIHVRKLENRVLQLEELLRKRQAGESKKIAFAFPQDMKVDINVPLQERIHIDPTYGIAHLPITGKSVSKVYIYNEMTNDLYVPPALKVDVLPASKNGWLVEENSPLMAFNGSNETHWHRKVSMALEDNVQSVTNEMVITLPDTMISNRNVNTITLNPFPVHSLQIDKVEYRLEGDWMLIPGWEVSPTTEKPVARTYTGNIKLCFPNTAMGQIRITMTQKDWFDENGKKVFHLGFQEVGIFYVDYQSSMGRVDIPITLASDTDSRLITGIKPVFENEQALSDTSVEKPSVFTYSIYTLNDKGQLQYTKDAFPILVSETQLVIKASIHSDTYNQTTPALKAIELTYEDV